MLDRNTQKLHLLPDAEIFSDVAGMEVFADFVRLAEYAPGEHIVEQGEGGTDLYVLIGGSAVVAVHMSDRCETVSRLTGKGVIGEIAFLLNKSYRTASVIATSPCRLLKFSRADFDKVLDEHPHQAAEFLIALAKRICRKLADTTVSLVNVQDGLNAMAEREGGASVEAVRENILSALSEILGDVPDETFARFGALTPEMRRQALEYAEKLPPGVPAAGGAM